MLCSWLQVFLCCWYRAVPKVRSGGQFPTQDYHNLIRCLPKGTDGFEFELDSRSDFMTTTARPHTLGDLKQSGYKSESVKAEADALHDALLAAGIDVVLDNRGERPGAMFADWELIGVPYRVVIGERGLKEGQVEFQGRTESAAQNIPLASIKDHVMAAVQAAKQAIA